MGIIPSILEKSLHYSHHHPNSGTVFGIKYLILGGRGKGGGAGMILGGWKRELLFKACHAHILGSQHHHTASIKGTDTLEQGWGGD